MRLYLRIQVDPLTGETWLYSDGRKSHPLDHDTVKMLKQEAELGHWHASEEAGQVFGYQLYRLLDGDGLLADARQPGKPLALYLELPEDWRQIPFEILWDGQRFLALERDVQIIRWVTDSESFDHAEVDRRQLRLLFMACSPCSLLPQLSFEAEEELILKMIEEEKLPLHMEVEESGSLQGLKLSLRDQGPFDILHLSGHAKLTEEGPVFFMESEIGEKVEVSPDELWQSLANRNIKLLFLSGCETAKTQAQATISFANAMVVKGIPMVIGWGLPVSDQGATRFATVLYKLLGEGLALDQAVNQARRAPNVTYTTWSLMRIFCDRSQLGALADPPQKVVARPRRQKIVHRLQQSQVKLLKYGFVGRRRQVQMGLRVLRGFEPDKNGLLITGTAGVGKSTLTGKLTERMAGKSFLVFPGRLEEGEILAKLLRLFDEKCPKALPALQSEVPFAQRIKTLFREVFQEVPTLIIFDDFEQNLIKEGETYRLMPGARRILQPFLEGLNWAEGQTQIVITCRHPFKLMREGRDWVASQLQHIPLMGLKGAALLKKRKLLDHLEASPHRDLFTKTSGGNPRLMERLEAVAEQMTDVDVVALAEACTGQSEIFIQEYLAQMLVDAQENTFQTFLGQASVYRIAVPAEAYASFGDLSFLEKAVGLTLMEREDEADVPHYWVLPMLRERFLANLTDPKEAHASAYQWYNSQTTDEGWHLEERLECIYHGSIAYLMDHCWTHALFLSQLYYFSSLFREGIDCLKPIIDYFDDEKVAKELRNGQKAPLSFLANYAGLLAAEADFASAKLHLEKVLLIQKRVHGDVHQEVIVSLNNLSGVLLELGNNKEARDCLEEALSISRHLFGDEHSETALCLNSLGGLLQDEGHLSAARTAFEEAVSIRSRVLGTEHHETLISLGNLGSVLQGQGDYSGAKALYEETLLIYHKLFEGDHSSAGKVFAAGRVMNNLATILREEGDYLGAKSQFEKSYMILESVFGEDHPQTRFVQENLETLNLYIDGTTTLLDDLRNAFVTGDPKDILIGKGYESLAASSAIQGGELEDELLEQVEELLEQDASQLELPKQMLQKKVKELLPEFEKRVLVDHCPVTDARFPWLEKEPAEKEEINKLGFSTPGEVSDDEENDDEITEIGCPIPGEIDDENLVQVHFATNRNLRDSQHPEKRFGSKRSELRYGTCLVSFPEDHKTGELERPVALRLEFRPNPKHHMMILDVTLQKGDDFFACVKARMETGDSKTAFVFVHGYNVSFTDAALRTAQMSRDLNYQGAPVFYSWPSKGAIFGYTHDESNVAWATTPLKGFLKDFVQRTQADHVVLIAHSMGNRAMTDAYLELLQEFPELAPKFKEIILAAPDIDADVFKRDIAPKMVSLNQPVTLYTGATDFALLCSKFFHGYPRAGHSKDGIVIVPGLETVDATHYATGFLRHSYISNSRDVINDVGYIIRHGHRADDRITLKPIDSPGGRYWEFKP